jgi:hypothetical protein
VRPGWRCPRRPPGGRPPAALTRDRVPQVPCLTGKSPNAVESRLQKYSASPRTQIKSISPAIPHPSEGRFAIVTNVGHGMRWTRRRALTNGAIRGRRSRVVLTPRRWRQVSRNDPRERRWQKSPVTGESAKEPVKTIAQGMPGQPGEPMATTLVCFLFRTRGCGCSGHPAFPAPSDSPGRMVHAQLGRSAPRGGGIVS